MPSGTWVLSRTLWGKESSCSAKAAVASSRAKRRLPMMIGIAGMSGGCGLVRRQVGQTLGKAGNGSRQISHTAAGDVLFLCRVESYVNLRLASSWKLANSCVVRYIMLAGNLIQCSHQVLAQVVLIVGRGVRSASSAEVGGPLLYAILENGQATRTIKQSTASRPRRRRCRTCRNGGIGGSSDSCAGKSGRCSGTPSSREAPFRWTTRRGSAAGCEQLDRVLGVVVVPRNAVVVQKDEELVAILV